jgi:hypothetical protein
MLRRVTATRGLWRYAAGAAALGALTLLACGSELKAQGEECFASSECASGLLCNFAADPPRCEAEGAGAPPPDAPPMQMFDAGPGPDAAPVPDAAPGTPDAAPPPDASPPDASPPDASLPDAGP